MGTYNEDLTMMAREMRAAGFNVEFRSGDCVAVIVPDTTERTEIRYRPNLTPEGIRWSVGMTDPEGDEVSVTAGSSNATWMDAIRRLRNVFDTLYKTNPVG